MHTASLKVGFFFSSSLHSHTSISKCYNSGAETTKSFLCQTHATLGSCWNRPACCLLPVSWTSLLFWSLTVTSWQKWHPHLPSMPVPQIGGNALYLQTYGGEAETSRNTRYQTLLIQTNSHTYGAKVDICNHFLPLSHSSITIWVDVEFLKELMALPFPSHLLLPSCNLNNSPAQCPSTSLFKPCLNIFLCDLWNTISLTASRPPCHVSHDLMSCSTRLSVTKLIPLKFKFVLDHNRLFAYVQGK